MKILTFDIEEWVIESHNANRKERFVLYDEMLDALLAKLDDRGVKATFFCLGEMARKFPHAIRKIADRGHEIGCHSDAHVWLNKMTRSEVEEDTKRAVSSLEDLVGKKVKAYRSPAFSIGESNTWAFDVLAANGIEYDSSVFPTKRDFGGFSSFGCEQPVTLSSNEASIREFPIALGNILGKRMVFSGGGYFRLLPLPLIKKETSKHDYLMFYFHINDLIVEKIGFMSRQRYEEYFKESGTLQKRLIRYFKSNVAVGNSFQKLSFMIDNFDFCNVEQASQMIEWEQQPLIKL